MLTLLAAQPESLWDESLPVEVRELPEDLAALVGGRSGVVGADLEHCRREVNGGRVDPREPGTRRQRRGPFQRLRDGPSRWRWNRHPLGGLIGDGGSPTGMLAATKASGSGRGIACSSSAV